MRARADFERSRADLELGPKLSAPVRGVRKGCTRVHAVNWGAGAAVLRTLATSYWRRYRCKGGSSPLACPLPHLPIAPPLPARRIWRAGDLLSRFNRTAALAPKWRKAAPGSPPSPCAPMRPFCTGQYAPGPRAGADMTAYRAVLRSSRGVQEGLRSADLRRL